MRMEDWTEKYRPKTLDDIVGNRDAKLSLRKWALEWKDNVPKRRAVILSGKPGIGKTSSALALANENGWTVIELNASDVRSADRIKRIATSGALNETFSDNGEFHQSSTGGRKLILLDEADNLYERKMDYSSDGNFLDRGGKRAIVDTIRTTKQPIILIVNDLYELLRGGGESLRNLCLTINFKSVPSYEIAKLLRKICEMENIDIDTNLLVTIAERSKGDVRSAIRDLQSLSIGRERVDNSTSRVLGYRDREYSIFELLRVIFKTRNISTVNRYIEEVGESPDDLILWIDENIPLEYQDAIDLSKAYELISKADVFLGRTKRKRSYGLWKYALDLMGGGVANAKKGIYQVNIRYSFPSWLREMKATREKRDIKNSILRKIGAYLHMSSDKTNEYVLSMLRRILQSDKKLLMELRDRLNLTDDEIIYIIGSEEKAHEIILDSKNMARAPSQEVILPQPDEEKVEEQSKLF